MTKEAEHYGQMLHKALNSNARINPKKMALLMMKVNMRQSML